MEVNSLSICACGTSGTVVQSGKPDEERVRTYQTVLQRLESSVGIGLIDNVQQRKRNGVGEWGVSCSHYIREGHPPKKACPSNKNHNDKYAMRCNGTSA